MRIEKLLPGIKKNVSLKDYTTFKIGGPARYFYIAKNKTELIEAIKTAKKLKLPFFILGGGSNLLVSDKGFKGLVIKIKSQKSKVKSTSQKSKIIETEAGALLGQLVALSIKNNLAGLEWAVGIPGTVGGAVWGNAGAFGKSVADITKEVEVFDVKKLRIKNYDLRNCKFGYRDSIFKKNKNLIILSAVLQLKKGKKSEIENKVKENLNYRRERQPLNFPSAGSIFKNPPGFFAGELVERCGLKGKKVGNVKISEIHSNFIVNLGQGTAKDVMRLIKIIKNKVKKKFGVVLEEEIQFL